MKALNSNVIFTRIEEKKKEKSEILLIEDEQPTYTYGKVVSTGKNCKELHVDDIILIPRHVDEFIIEGIRYLICREEDISSVFHKYKINKI